MDQFVMAWGRCDDYWIHDGGLLSFQEIGLLFVS
jgi:hypothetical protein